MSCLAVAGLVSLTLAQPEPSQPATEPPRLVVMLGFPDIKQISEWAATAIASHLSDQNARLEVVWLEGDQNSQLELVGDAERIARERGAALVFWADYAQPNAVYFYLVASGRLVERHLETDGSSWQGRLEATAVLVRAVVSAGDQEPAQLALTSDAATVAVPPALARFELHATGGALSFAREHSAALFGRATIAFRVHEQMVLHAGYRWLPAQRFADELGTLALKQHLFEAGMSYRWQADSWHVDAGGGLLSGPVQWSMRPQQENVEPSQHNSGWLWGLSAHAAVARRVSTFCDLLVVSGLDALLTERRYGAQSSRGDVTLAAPWTLRPWISAGFVLRMP